MLPKRRTAIVGLLVAGICVLVLWAFLVRTDRDDPLVKGKHLSTHLLVVFGPVGNEAEKSVGRGAIKAQGTNCVPLLRHWITNELPPWRIKLGARLWKWGVVSPALPPEELPIVAVGATELLNTNGVGVFADLVAACTNSNARLADAAARSLAMCYLQLSHIPVESQEALQPKMENAISVLEAGRNADPNLRGRAAFLSKALERPSLMAYHMAAAFPDEQANTLRLFSRRNEKFVEMLPLLLEHLQSTNAMLAENAAICLCNYGAQAKSALPALEKAMSHPDGKVRAEAAEAKAMILAPREGPWMPR